jgi:hypothetical protein
VDLVVATVADAVREYGVVGRLVAGKGLALGRVKEVEVSRVEEAGDVRRA